VEKAKAKGRKEVKNFRCYGWQVLMHEKVKASHTLGGRGNIGRDGVGTITAACKQFRRPRRKKSTRLGMVEMTVGPVYTRMRACKERASTRIMYGRTVFAACNQFRRPRWKKSTRFGMVAMIVGPVYTRMRACKSEQAQRSYVGAQSLPSGEISTLYCRVRAKHTT
jgi:hypothetical protein